MSEKNYTPRWPLQTCAVPRIEILLESGLDDYIVPAHFYTGATDDLVKHLLLNLKVSLFTDLTEKCLDSAQSLESLDLEQSVAWYMKSLDPAERIESLDPMHWINQCWLHFKMGHWVSLLFFTVFSFFVFFLICLFDINLLIFL